MKKLTELLGVTGICPALKKIAEASDANFTEVEKGGQGGGGEQPSGGLTKAEADKLYQPLGNYQPQGNYAPAAPVDDPYVNESKIKDFVKIEEVDGKKVLVLPIGAQLMGKIDGGAIYALASLRKYAQETGADLIQVEIGTTKFHLNLNTLDDVTVDTPEGKKKLQFAEEGKGLSTNDYTTEDKEKLDGIDANNIPWRIDIPLRGVQFNKVFAEETILSDWFHVASRADLKSLILKKQLVEVYGITLTYNPHYYRMPVHYAAFESDTQVKLVWVGLDTSNDVVSKYTCIINLDGTVIENGCNVQLTLKAIETE